MRCFKKLGLMSGLLSDSLQRKNPHLGPSLVVQWLRLLAPSAGCSGSIPGQGTRFHMPQLRVLMPQRRPSAAKQIHK